MGGDNKTKGKGRFGVKYWIGFLTTMHMGEILVPKS